MRLSATMFHAGLIDTAPRLRRPDQSAVRHVEWAAISPTYAATAHRYVDQIELNLRPSSVSEAERSLRELGSLLARDAPEVLGIADIRRDHIEAYKIWLATRPRLGGGTLHHHTIRARLLALRCCFERITEWGYHDSLPGRRFFDVDMDSSYMRCPVHGGYPNVTVRT